jgi:hypothetical protein
MTLIIQKPTGAKLVMRKGWQPMDADAAAYITAVETADAQALEERTKIAIDNFVLGCKEDGIWTAIKASCILAGARTLTGALVPLVGTAPTNNNFVSGDYNRKTGLVGNGSTKYLDANRLDNQDGQNNNHLAVWVQSNASTGSFIGARGATLRIVANAGAYVNASQLQLWTPAMPTFAGAKRDGATSAQTRINRSSANNGLASAALSSNSVFVFAYNFNGVVTQYTDARLAFYSIGESLDLALLDARVTDLINAFAAAIP